MNTSPVKRFIALFLAFFTLLLPINNANAYQRPAQAADLAPTNEMVYLPLVTTPLGPLPDTTPFGVETSRKDGLILDRAQDANVSWLRLPAFSWAAIEPVLTDPPTYHWENVNETFLRDAAAHGDAIIATIRYTPAWAQKYAGYTCGPIAESAFPAFVEFVEALVKRYSSYPYNIRYWEVGNEVDIDPYEFAFPTTPDYVFGCWGDSSDPYYGGGYYAQMLEQVYPAIKAIDPHAQVLSGGLLVDCDPTHPPQNKSCDPAKFFEGILRYKSFTGAQYFDLVSYHGYAAYYNDIIVDENWPEWAHRGGVVLGKADYLREVMDTYGVSKPIMLTEGALACPEWDGNTSCDPPISNFYEAQADYVSWLFVRNFEADIDTTVWFTIEEHGWRYVGLLNEDDSPRPAYNAYQFTSSILENATYNGKLTQFTGLRAFAFSKDAVDLWVIWSPDQFARAALLPPNTIRVLNKYGAEIQTGGGLLPVKSPIYVELTP